MGWWKLGAGPKVYGWGLSPIRYFLDSYQGSIYCCLGWFNEKSCFEVQGISREKRESVIQTSFQSGYNLHSQYSPLTPPHIASVLFHSGTGVLQTTACMPNLSCCWFLHGPWVKDSVYIFSVKKTKDQKRNTINTLWHRKSQYSQIKFHWITAMLTCLHTVCGCFHTTVQNSIAAQCPRDCIAYQI